jgi:tetratricopeptide (TPR) repeat protein
VRCLLIVGAPVVFALVLEGSLWLWGYGKPTDLFIPDAKPGYWRTNPNFTTPYFPEQFDLYPLNFRIARHKEPGHLRIFVLGESAVKGTPESGFGFASLLGAQMRAAYPDKQFEVYNLGIVAINSHVVYQVATQVAAALEPDLFVVYLGNNEVVGPYGPGSVNLSALPPLWVIRTSIWIRGTRTGQLLQHLIGFATKAADRRPLEWHGMSTFAGQTVRGDDPRLTTVYRNYEANLRGITSVAAQAGIKTILATVVANLKDCPPFASLHRAALTEPDLKRWNLLYAEGKRAWELDQSDRGIQAITAALAIDPEYAEAHYILAQLLDGTGDQRGARTQYLDALHWDALRFRPDAPINVIARQVASESAGEVVLVDAARTLGADAASDFPSSGREILLEHVHFNWEGNVRLGRILAENSAAALFGPKPPPGHWLDEPGCAKAVGYTAFGRLRMLELMEPIRSRPPFTQQLTFGEDQVRYQQEIARAEQPATSAAGLAAARAQLETALTLDPANPDLLLRLCDLEIKSNHPARVLELTDQLMELLPRSSELVVRRSRALAALQRSSEAQAGIIEALRIDPYNLPAYTALVEVLRQTGDFDTGVKLFATALNRIPASEFIRLSYADLLFFHGDRAKAVAECQLVLARDPASSDALRRLVSLYTAEGKNADAFALMAAARTTQPLNFENNLALARLYEARGEIDQVADCLQAAAVSGPATAQAHLYLARYWKDRHRPADALLELARARRIAVLTGDQKLAGEITDAIRLSQDH